jgi:CTP synthase
MGKNIKYIFITGGVTSSLGKGIVAASLGVLLKDQGFKVTIQKFDPYLNVDPGTMNPYEHGEVFVTDDGSETDLDLGHYERFIDQSLSKANNITSGMVFSEVLKKERRGDYLGSTVQIIPHVTNEIKKRITKPLENADFDFVITEVGGTVGDIESLPFLESIRQFQSQNKANSIHIHLTLVPYLKTSGEFKTKPTQHSVKELRTIGITSDIIICRSEIPFQTDIKEKIALFCDVNVESVIACPDAQSIYEVPLLMKDENLHKEVLEKLNLPVKTPQLTEWKAYVAAIQNTNQEQITISIVGKYTELSDAYLSVVEALKHAAAANNSHCNIQWINSEELLESNVNEFLKTAQGILIPGGFGDRGIDGKLLASKYARENNIPFLGLCLGMHVALIDFARHVLNLKEAHSTEFNYSTEHPVIDYLPQQKELTEKGGTMRLGSYPCSVKTNSKLFELYGENNINERHRHRYEFNNTYKTLFEDAGMVFSGTSPDGELVEVIEFPKHPFFMACQFHPELKSRPYKSHPLFKGLIKQALEQKKSNIDYRLKEKSLK